MKPETDKLLAWLHAHPLIKISPLERLCGVPDDVIQKALDKRQALSEKHVPAITKILKDYGFKTK